jgi:hypothetical protein
MLLNDRLQRERAVLGVGICIEIERSSSWWPSACTSNEDTVGQCTGPTIRRGLECHNRDGLQGVRPRQARLPTKAAGQADLRGQMLVLR